MEKDAFVFFWGHTSKDNKITKSCFSQWYMAPFVVNEKKYICAEQYMMEQKALLFNNNDIAEKIMATENPSEHKSLGREIVGFNDVEWDKFKYEFVFKANLAKFSQNIELKEFLLSTGSKILVEASPYDQIWGIGLSATDEKATNPAQWRGQNLLGMALMQVRALLVAEV